MFESATEESVIVRPETVFFYICSIFFLVNVGLITTAGVYTCLGMGLFAYEPDDVEIELENAGIKAYREEGITEKVYNCELLDREDLSEIGEAAPENVTFLMEDPLEKKFIENCTVIKLPIKTKFDRFDFIFPDMNEDGDVNMVKFDQQKNILRYRLASSNKFSAAELAYFDCPEESDLSEEKQKETRKLKDDLYEYQELMRTVNAFLFETNVARGVYSFQEYDYELFWAGSSQNFAFDGCKLISGNNEK